jgi:predicted FMN-binding regulatory protein PaiB
MSVDELASHDDDEALLHAFDRLERAIKAEFGSSVGENDPEQMVRLVALLDDVQRVAAAMRLAQERLRSRIDGAASGLTAINAYGLRQNS